jgi:hypothetical protein
MLTRINYIQANLGSRWPDSISKITRAKWTKVMVQVLQCLLYKYRALSSNHSHTKEKKIEESGYFDLK